MPTHPLNQDPYAAPPSEEQQGTRHPQRFEPKQNTTGNTQTQQRMRARVYRSTSTQSIPNGTATNTIVTFDTAAFDSAGLLSSNGFKIPTTGKITGVWKISAHLTWDLAPSGYREMNIIENGVVVASDHHAASNDQQSQNLYFTVNDPKPGNLYQVMVNQNSGGALNIITDPPHTYFTIIHLW